MAASKQKMSRGKQPASAAPLRQTRCRSKLGNAAPLMSGLDHRGAAIDPLVKDPENLTCDEVLKRLGNKKKITFHMDTSDEEEDTSSQEEGKKSKKKNNKKITILRKSPASSENNDNSSPKASTKEPSPKTDPTPIESSGESSPPKDNKDDTSNKDNEGSTPTTDESPPKDNKDDTSNKDNEGSTPTTDETPAGVNIPSRFLEEQSLFVESPVEIEYPSSLDTVPEEEVEDHVVSPAQIMNSPQENADAALPRKRRRAAEEEDDNSRESKSPRLELIATESASAGLASSNSGSTVDVCSVDSESLIGAENEPRTHYDWVEQWHEQGSDCNHVHGHQSHVEWNTRWNAYFEAKKGLYEALKKGAIPGLNIQQDFMGSLMENEAWRDMSLDPLPPVGGSLREHPDRAARRELLEQHDVQQAVEEAVEKAVQEAVDEATKRLGQELEQESEPGSQQGSEPGSEQESQYP